MFYELHDALLHMLKEDHWRVRIGQLPRQSHIKTCSQEAKGLIKYTRKMIGYLFLKVATMLVAMADLVYDRPRARRFKMTKIAWVLHNETTNMCFEILSAVREVTERQNRNPRNNEYMHMRLYRRTYGYRAATLRDEVRM